jgi:phosphohistidine phosphatase
MPASPTAEVDPSYRNMLRARFCYSAACPFPPFPPRQYPAEAAGTFKYVLMKVSRPGGTASDAKFIVRGHARHGFHDDVYQEARAAIEAFPASAGLRVACVGGGRIRHAPNEAAGTILVYGYSVGHGRADHAQAVCVLRRAYPSYANIGWSNDGY